MLEDHRAPHLMKSAFSPHDDPRGGVLDGPIEHLSLEVAAPRGHERAPPSAGHLDAPSTVGTKCVEQSVAPQGKLVVPRKPSIGQLAGLRPGEVEDRKSTRLNSSH